MDPLPLPHLFPSRKFEFKPTRLCFFLLLDALFLSLRTTDILGWNTFCCAGAVLCIVGFSTASLASPHLLPVALTTQSLFHTHTQL